jgi:predicted nuclease with TOPRIM domain
MSNEKIFSAREHLESFVVATQGVFSSSENPSDIVVAGIFQACLERMDHLYSEIDRLTKENVTHQADVRRLKSSLDTVESGKIRLEADAEKYKNTISSLEYANCELKKKNIYLKNVIASHANVRWGT